MDTIRVTLIEDHDLTRMGLRTILEVEKEIKVVGEARNGMSGLQLLYSTQPDIAIVDVGLPEMNGIELTQTFKNSLDAESSIQTKILIMTMNHSEDTVLAAFAAGADSYFMKDSDIDRFVEAVKITHSGNSWIDPSIARIILEKSTKNLSAQNNYLDTVEIHGLSLEENQLLNLYPLTSRELEVLN
ncbi:MAG: response regulator transcription factor, partial [Sphaerospermopsis sp.]|nr:response regulator transcription factor [Sphaerospermopsis sp.]